MGNMYLSNAGTFLVHTFFGIVLLVILLRFLMQIVRADFRNPVSQFIVKVTNPVLKPLRRFIPGFGGVDLASLILLLFFQALELVLVAFMLGAIIHPAGLLVLSIAELMDLVAKVYLFGILIQIIISWVNPGSYNPVISILHSINEPLLSRARKIIPPISGFDLSPILVIVALQLVTMLVVVPIADFGRSLA